tara:strand:+ start:363 stop:533 length:171 start_codon:yes stop_codon:yes gene_type:complete
MQRYVSPGNPVRICQERFESTITAVGANSRQTNDDVPNGFTVVGGNDSQESWAVHS